MWYTSPGGMQISFSTRKPCIMHMGVLRIVGFVQAVIALLTRILSSFSLLGSHVRDSQFAYRWCHSLTASVEPRAILGQYHNAVISPSGVAERSKARTLPTQKGAPHLRIFLWRTYNHKLSNCYIYVWIKCWERLLSTPGILTKLPLDCKAADNCCWDTHSFRGAGP